MSSVAPTTGVQSGRGGFLRDEKPPIKPGEKVPWPQKLCYGAGCLAGQFAGSITTSMFNPVFNIGMGISPNVIGIILMIYRGYDAVTDVVMGNISDNTRTRWGRRRPYIVVGTFLLGFLLPVLWQASPHWSHSTIIAYLVVVGLALYTAVSIWSMPYYSLGMEMTPNYDERTRVTAVRAVFEKSSGLFGGWMLALVSLPYFGKLTSGDPDVAHGMRVVSWGLGAAVILTGVLPGFFVKERYYQKDARKQPRIGLWFSLKTTFKCPPFMILMGAYVMQILGSSMVGSLGLYLNIYYVNGGNVHTAGIIQGWKLTAMMALGILCIPVWVWLAEKIGKNRALGLTIAMGFVTNILIYFCYTPKHPYLQILPSLFLSAFGTSVWMLVPSMQADIADYDELNTGERREGSFSSISSWFFKLSMTVTAGVSGVILTWTGFDVVRYGKSQPPAVLHTMLLWYIFLPMVFWTMALALLYFYPLNRATIGDIRRRLEERRGAI